MKLLYEDTRRQIEIKVPRDNYQCQQYRRPEQEAALDAGIKESFPDGIIRIHYQF